MVIAMFVLAIIFLIFLAGALIFALIEEYGYDMFVPGMTCLAVAGVVAIALATLAIINFSIGG